MTDIESASARGDHGRDLISISPPSATRRTRSPGGELREYGLKLAAVNAAGNLLHPDPVKRSDAQTRFKAAVELAVAFGVERVITMSGCPAGPGSGSLGVFPCWATSADDERLFDWQLEHEVGPYWRATSEWLVKTAPQVMVCLELHPGVTIFSAAGFEALIPYIRRNIGLNLDPSHFWWQGIDPITVVETLGDRIGYAHGKDTLLYPERIRRKGVLHFAPPSDPKQAPWHFASVGEGHDDATWAALIAALRTAGYDDVISIEHEDPRYDGEEGTTRSLAGLQRRARTPGGRAMTTLFDVARLAGVSKSTVSNVIRGNDSGRRGDPHRVQQAITESHYHPNVIARSLKEKTSTAIGIIVPDLINPFHAELAAGAERAANALGYAALIAHTECLPSAEKEAARAFIERRVDGVIIGGISVGSALPSLLLDRDIPVVVASFGEPDDPRLGVIDHDDPAAMEAIVDHLYRLGHRRMSFVPLGAPEQSGERRRVGFKDALARRDLVPVALDDGATAAVAHNDMIAIATISRLERCGLRVPHDISVVGYDDIPMAAHSRIRLTTVRSDAAQMGRRAIELVVDAIDQSRHVAHERSKRTRW